MIDPEMLTRLLFMIWERIRGLALVNNLDCQRVHKGRIDAYRRECSHHGSELWLGMRSRLMYGTSKAL